MADEKRSIAVPVSLPKTKLRKKEAKDKEERLFSDIPDLSYHEQAIDAKEEKALIDWITQPDARWQTTAGSHWQSSNEKGFRVVQQYGHAYDYAKKRVIIANPNPNSLPLPLQSIAQQLVKRKFLTRMPTQIIINRYLPGEGISAHTDHPDFGEEISSLSLNSDASMFWSPPDPTERPIKIPVSRCSLLVMRGEARHLWKHAVPGSKRRGIRYSLTMRTLKTEDQAQNKSIDAKTKV